MTMTSKDFEELYKLLAKAGGGVGGGRTTILTGKSAQQIMERGRYLQALERHGPELIDLAYKGSAARMIVGEIMALIPADQVAVAGQNGATLVEWLRANIKTETKNPN